ncbi:DUF6261 family protein [Saccharicrinis aurantiacus]|uniref:DUF6261 family protein n=1 Tax=Saccharicrinis aurantiacus TaxID=1849719 RepID=UPI00249187A2|nr:DUF6261 family protein [Saccharicrinis aurantiacus]
MIKKVMTTVRNADIHALSTKIVAAVSSDILESDAHLGTITTEMDTKNSLLLTAINKDKMHSSLEELDDERDQAFKSILQLTEGYKHYPDATIAAAALEIGALNNKYKNDILGSSYNSQNTYSESYSEDMTKPKYANAMAQLPGVLPLFESFNTKQQAFASSQNTLQMARVNEDEMPAATEIKKELIKIINGKLVVYLQFLQKMATPEYAEVCTAIELLIDAENTKIKQRSSKLNN